MGRPSEYLRERELIDKIVSKSVFDSENRGKNEKFTPQDDRERNKTGTKAPVEKSRIIKLFISPGLG